MSFNPLRQLIAPDARMINIRRGVQGEVAARLVVGAIHCTQAALFFLRDARHLRLVRIERRQRFLGVPSVAIWWKWPINWRISFTGLCHSKSRVDPIPSV